MPLAAPSTGGLSTEGRGWGIRIHRRSNGNRTMSKSHLYYLAVLTIILTLGLILWQWPQFEGLLRSMIETKGLR